MKQNSISEFKYQAENEGKFKFYAELLNKRSKQTETKFDSLMKQA